MNSTNKLPIVIILAQIVLGLWAFFYILYIGQAIILPLIYALIFAILLNPLVNFFVRKGINRIIAIISVILLAVIFVSGVIYFVGSQSVRLGESLPALQQKLTGIINDMILWASQKLKVDVQKINEWLTKMKSESINISGSTIGKTLMTVTGLLTVLFLIPVYIFMFIYYKPLLLEFIHKLFRKEKQSSVAEVLNQSKSLIQGYLAGLLVEAVIVATLNSIGLLALGIQYAILLGIIGAILNVIPYIGGIIAIALPMIIAMGTKSPIYALWVLVVYMIIQFIDNHFLIPKIVASRVKLNALVSIVVVFIGGALWGVPGMFLSIPLTALIKVILDRIESLEPFGFLLGDTMPPTIANISMSLKPKKNKK
jgi:predicted PurR-regulated permease PerM